MPHYRTCDEYRNFQVGDYETTITRIKIDELTSTAVLSANIFTVRRCCIKAEINVLKINISVLHEIKLNQLTAIIIIRLTTFTQIYIFMRITEEIVQKTVSLNTFP